MSNRIEELEGISGSGSKRQQAWKMAQQFQQQKFSQQNQNNSAFQDETGNKKYALVDKSAQSEQEIHSETFDEVGSEGKFHAGSTITSSQRSDTGGGGSGFNQNGGNQHQRGDGVQTDSNKLAKGKIKNISVNLFDD